MKAQIQSLNEHEASLSFQDADIATMYIMQHELLKMSEVGFAGVIVKHPLTGECWMRITVESEPQQSMANALDVAIRTVDEMKDAMLDVNIS